MQAAFDLNELTTPIPFTRREQEVHERALARAENFRRSEAEMLETIDEVQQFRLYEKLRLTGIHEYCVKIMKLSESVAGYFIYVANKSRAIPELREAIKAQEIPVSKAAKFVSVVTPENKSEWIEKAKTMSVRQIEKEVVKEKPGKARRTSTKSVAPDVTRLGIDADDELMELIERAKEVAKSNDLKTVLKAALKEYLRRKDPVAKAERARTSSREEKVAKKDRIPAASRHAVNKRDRGECQARHADGSHCARKMGAEIHHIITRANGGSHEPENLITLCHHHHKIAHEVDEITV